MAAENDNVPALVSVEDIVDASSPSVHGVLQCHAAWHNVKPARYWGLLFEAVPHLPDKAIIISNAVFKALDSFCCVSEVSGMLNFPECVNQSRLPYMLVCVY